MYSIYALADPREAHPVRRFHYVGATHLTLRKRLQLHRSTARYYAGKPRVGHHGETPRDRWIAKLGRAGVVPTIHLLEEVNSGSWTSERGHIRRLLALGARLVNCDGVPGYKSKWWTKEMRAAAGARSRKRWADPVKRKRIVVAQTAAAGKRELRLQRSHFWRRLWKNRTFRAKMRKVRESKEFQVKMSRSLRRPEIVQKRSATMKAKWRKTEYRRKVSAGISRSWRNPVVRERKRAALRAAWAKRR